MSDVEAHNREVEYPTPKLLRPTFSPWLTIIVIAAQTILCGLTWGFVGLMIVRIIPVHDNLANWINDNPSGTNMMITVISTVLALIGSSQVSSTLLAAQMTLTNWIVFWVSPSSTRYYFVFLVGFPYRWWHHGYRSLEILSFSDLAVICGGRSCLCCGSP